MNLPVEAPDALDAPGLRPEIERGNIPRFKVACLGVRAASGFSSDCQFLLCDAERYRTLAQDDNSEDTFLYKTVSKADVCV